MAYTVSRTLIIKELKQKLQEKLEVIDHLIRRNECADDALEFDGCAKADTKWYSFENDLRQFSKKYPHLTFEFWCEGSDGVQWKDYFKDGKHCQCESKIVYEPFKTENLK